MKRTEIKRGKPMARGRGVKRANPRRRKAAHARNFGEEADRVRAMPCLCAGHPAAVCAGVADRQAVEAAHVKARGMGAANGGRFDIVPLCPRHHDSSAAGVEAFERNYGLDLRAEADRVALLHEAPLGVRGLAQRWAAARDDEPNGEEREERAFAADEWGLDPCELDWPTSKPLDTYELAALLGWVRRRLEATTQDGPVEARACRVALQVRLTAGQAVELVDAAVEGWRS